MNLRKLPKVRHRKGKYLGKNLWECSDARATSESKFEGSEGGGGYIYYLYKEQVSTVQKECDKLLKKLGNSAQGNKRSSARTDGVG